jgi:hypothetical protein
MHLLAVRRHFCLQPLDSVQDAVPNIGSRPIAIFSQAVGAFGRLKHGVVAVALFDQIYYDPNLFRINPALALL